jgi:hypothetical protein
MAQEKYLDCIEACNHCANECTYCASACLQEDDVQSMTRCITLDRDCAAICRTTSMLLSADSEFAAEICRLCAEGCRACGEECRKHDMQHCQDCADQCERCAEECERMAKKSAGAGAEPRSKRKATGKIQTASARATNTMTTDRSVRPTASSLRRRQTAKH